MWGDPPHPPRSVVPESMEPTKETPERVPWLQNCPDLTKHEIRELQLQQEEIALTGINYHPNPISETFAQLLSKIQNESDRLRDQLYDLDDL